MPKRPSDNLARSGHPVAGGESIVLATKSDVANAGQVDVNGDKIISRSLLVNQDTNAKLTMYDGVIVENVPLQKGYNNIRVRQVYSTGTDAVSVFFVY